MEFLASVREGGLWQQGRSIGKGKCVDSYISRLMLVAVTNKNNNQWLKHDRSLFLACVEFKKVILCEWSALFLSFRELSSFCSMDHLALINAF